MWSLPTCARAASIKQARKYFQELRETALSIKGGHTVVYKLFYGELNVTTKASKSGRKLTTSQLCALQESAEPDGKLLRQVYYLYIYADAGKLSLCESAQIKR